MFLFNLPVPLALLEQYNMKKTIEIESNMIYKRII